MKNYKSRSKENIEKGNKWSVIAVYPPLPDATLFESDHHYQEIYLNNLKEYSWSGEVPFTIYFNSRQELYQIYSYLLDLGYSHIKVNDPCDERGDDTFRRYNSRVWLDEEYLELESANNFKGSKFQRIVYSWDFCFNRCGLVTLTVQVPIKYFSEFMNNIYDIRDLRYKLLILDKSSPYNLLSNLAKYTLI